jgi:hypothetical protein
MFAVEVQMGNVVYGCGYPNGSTGTQTITGTSLGWMNTGTTISSIALDTCPPNADCIASVYVVRLGMGGNDRVTVPAGALLRVDFDVVQGPSGCKQRILGTRVDEWAGIKNPIGNLPLVLFAASDGTWETIPGVAPFASAPYALGCEAEMDAPCGLPADAYGLTVHPTGGVGVDVGMGETVSHPLFGGAPGDSYRIHNLRSYSTGSCEDDAHWAWWMFPDALAT